MILKKKKMENQIQADGEEENYSGKKKLLLNKEEEFEEEKEIELKENSILSEKKLLRNKLSKLQEIASSLNIILYKNKNGKNKRKTKKELISEILK